jgi:hypothetical protein
MTRIGATRAATPFLPQSDTCRRAKEIHPRHETVNNIQAHKFCVAENAYFP